MQGVAHFAHLGGAATGLLLLLYWRARGRSRPPDWPDVLGR